MKVLITGNMGYVGSVLTKYLKKNYPKIFLIGYDSSFFGHSLLSDSYLPELGISIQHFGDIRDMQRSILTGVDAIVHLAGISNDPIGNEFEDVTTEINRYASTQLVKNAIEENVKNFVFASSCSIYGQSTDKPKVESDQTSPLTAYAKSKIDVEQDVKNINLNKMTFTSLRFATACGWSERLRLDLVLNDFVASAITTGKIDILSDGTPWRPLIDVEDMCRAIHWGIERNSQNGGQFLVVNTGKNSINYQVKQIAETVSEMIPNTYISINKNASQDKRSYLVDFSMYEKLAPDFQPILSLKDSISRLKKGLTNISFHNKNFRNSSFIRLNTLRNHINEKRLGKDLRWKNF